MEFSLSGLKCYGFLGFARVGDLKASGCGVICKRPGVYVILREEDTKPQFLRDSIGGHFKGKDPTVCESILRNSWVCDTPVVYIGKAGGGTSAATLYSRLKQYMEFGNGKPVGHWGGRYIWQLADSDELILAWKPLETDDAREVEKALIREFELHYGKVPFANLAR